MTDVNRIAEVEMHRKRRDVGGIVVHVMAINRLAGSTVTAAIMSNHTIAFVEKVKHLAFPIVGRQWPAVVEDDRLRGLGAPIAIEDFRSVSGRDRRRRYLGREIIGRCSMRKHVSLLSCCRRRADGHGCCVNQRRGEELAP
jgi:hypothetical protein